MCKENNNPVGHVNRAKPLVHFVKVNGSVWLSKNV